MNWYKSCTYDDAQKRSFHTTGLNRLKVLAKTLGFAPGSFDIRSNHGGIAVSGEVTLHHEQLYVQVSQPATRVDTGILIRICKGRKDYTGGRNNFAPLAMFDDIPALTERCRAVLRQGG
jgi:hypothetical protein